MKTRISILLALVMSMAGFSQKAEIKAADKAMKSGNAAEAKTILTGAMSLIDGSDAKYQAQAYSILGNAHLNLSEFVDFLHKNDVFSTKNIYSYTRL